MTAVPQMPSFALAGRWLALISILAAAPPARYVYSQAMSWGAGAGASFQRLSLESPLPEWAMSGLVFPSLLVYSEIPLPGIEGPLGERLSLLAGTRYNRQSGRIDWTFLVGDPVQQFEGDFTLRQHYLSLPIWLNFRPGGPIWLVGGVEPGVLLFADKVSRTTAPATAASHREEAVADDLRRLHLALRAGAGISVGTHARLLVSYVAGLTSAKIDADRPVLISDWRTREWELMLLFRLRE
jgi:hypothetical protein